MGGWEAPSSFVTVADVGEDFSRLTSASPSVTALEGEAASLLVVSE
jgi:hypothetical protein